MSSPPDLDWYVRVAVDAAPTLSDEQRATLRRLLDPVSRIAEAVQRRPDLPAGIARTEAEVSGDG